VFHPHAPLAVTVNFRLFLPRNLVAVGERLLTLHGLDSRVRRTGNGRSRARTGGHHAKPRAETWMPSRPGRRALSQHRNGEKDKRTGLPYLIHDQLSPKGN
jgi:hypothetical protein